MSGQNIYPVHNALHLLAAPHSITQMLQFDHDERKTFGWKFDLTLNFQTKHVRRSVLIYSFAFLSLLNKLFLCYSIFNGEKKEQS